MTAALLPLLAHGQLHALELAAIGAGASLPFLVLGITVRMSRRSDRDQR